MSRKSSIFAWKLKPFGNAATLEKANTESYAKIANNWRS